MGTAGVALVALVGAWARPGTDARVALERLLADEVLLPTDPIDHRQLTALAATDPTGKLGGLIRAALA
jgi:hypothetical protein